MKIIVSKKEAEKLSEQGKIVFYDNFGNKYKCNPKTKRWQVNEYGYGLFSGWEYCTHTNSPKTLYTLSMQKMAEKLQEHLDERN